MCAKEELRTLSKMLSLLPLPKHYFTPLSTEEKRTCKRGIGAIFFGTRTIFTRITRKISIATMILLTVFVEKAFVISTSCETLSRFWKFLFNWSCHVRSLTSVFLFSADFDDSDSNHFKATVMYDGKVTWVVPMITMSSCQISVEHFPLDEQVSNVTSYLMGNQSVKATDVWMCG